MIGAFVGLMISALTTGAVAYGLVRVVGTLRDRSGPSHDLRESVARFFRLGLLAATTALVAEGATGLLGEALPRSGELVRNADRLARSLAFLVVGAPALAGLVVWTRRVHRDEPAEARTPGWAVCTTGGELVSLVVLVASADGVLDRVVSDGALARSAVARALAWAPVWWITWTLSQRRPRPAGSTPLHLLAGSAFALATFASGSGVLLRNALRLLYQDRFFDVLHAGDGDDLRRPVATVVVGAAAWWWYWLRHARSSVRCTHWYAYVLLLGVSACLIAAVTGAATVVHAVLQWNLGDPRAISAAAHFRGLPSGIAAALVGGAAWAYHRSLLGLRVARPRTEIDRIALYLTSAIGLVTTTVAATMAFAALLEAVARPSSIAGRSGVSNALVTAATLLAVGGPVWLRSWREAQGRVRGRVQVAGAATTTATGAATTESDGELVAEQQSVARHVYLLALFGVAAAAALVSLVVTLVLLFEDVGRSRAGVGSLFRVRVPFGLVLTLGAMAAYHGIVSRRDRSTTFARGGIGAGVPVLRHVLVLGKGGDALGAAMRASLGSRVTAWEPIGEPTMVPAGATHDDVAAAVRACGAAEVAVLPGNAGTRVVAVRAV